MSSHSHALRLPRHEEKETPVHLVGKKKTVSRGTIYSICSKSIISNIEK
uniref:Uncharacterized protein n=1 Tax=Myoviridae sp. ctUPB15 TaxID=2825116 RepID=A0A8S5PVN3_9CAUD|nr:MAG TPA: hypothetical protein [Myoviridae sp. ctUPB15]DAR50102.1 MAG TPA: hypothetical protein [Caudoviricetes sp.]